MYIQNEQPVMGIILRYVCWGNTPPPWGGGSPAVGVNGGAPDAARVCGTKISRSGLTKQLQLLPLAVLSLVRDILQLNYCTKLVHQTVHALSARSCKTRRNIEFSRGKHCSNKTAFLSHFCRIFRIFHAFFRIFGQSRRPHPPPPPARSRIPHTPSALLLQAILLLCAMFAVCLLLCDVS